VYWRHDPEVEKGIAGQREKADPESIRRDLPGLQREAGMENPPMREMNHRRSSAIVFMSMSENLMNRRINILISLRSESSWALTVARGSRRSQHYQVIDDTSGRILIAIFLGDCHG